MPQKHSYNDPEEMTEAPQDVRETWEDMGQPANFLIVRIPGKKELREQEG